MRIGFDGKRAVQNFTGLGNYSRYIVDILCQFYPENEYVLYAPKKRELSRIEITDRPFIYQCHTGIVQIGHIRRKPQHFLAFCAVFRLIELSGSHIHPQAIFCCEFEITLCIGRTGQMIMQITSFGHFSKELSQAVLIVMNGREVFAHYNRVRLSINCYMIEDTK